MLTRLLEQLGLFVGWRKQSDHEALFFLALNQWLLAQCGGSWDRPDAIRDLERHSEVRILARDYLEVSLRSARSISFLGPLRWMRHRDPTALSEPWGWKDPRTTFTLPFWLDLFPEAKVLHVYRHGVDVAQSLRKRQSDVVEYRKQRYHRLRWSYFLRAKRGGFGVGLRCASLDEGFALWESYMERGRREVEARGALGLGVSYESFLAEPSRKLLEIAGFCGLEPDLTRCEQAVSGVRADRGLAYRSDPELVAFSDAMKDRLAKHGY
jgi:hypothetical protein